MLAVAYSVFLLLYVHMCMFNIGRYVCTCVHVLEERVHPCLTRACTCLTRVHSSDLGLGDHEMLCLKYVHMCVVV